MKTSKNSSRAMKTIRIITEIFALQINFLFAATPGEIIPVNQFSMCVPCFDSASATQKEILFNELLVLAPTTPAKATFPDEATFTEINLAPTAPAEAPFDNDPEFISESALEYLAPTTPAEAGFDDCNLCI